MCRQISAIHKIACSVLGLLGLVGCAGNRSTTSSPSPAFTSYADVAYASASPTETLDLYVPTAGSGPFPLIIFIHGGAFATGSKADLDSTLQQAFINAGMAIASINYRLLGEALFPAGTQDAKAAVRFLRANAGKYNLNANKFVVFGESAGANLAALIGVTGNNTTFDNAFLGNVGVSSQVQGVIDWSGPTDFLQIPAQSLTQGCLLLSTTSASLWLQPYIGGDPAAVPTVVKQTNPINFVAKGLPPFLIQHGDQDCVVPYAQSQILNDAIVAAGGTVTLEKLSGAAHLTPTYFEASANVTRIVNFARSVF